MKSFLFGSRANNHFTDKSDYDYYDIEKDFDKFQKNLKEHKLVELEIYCRYNKQISHLFDFKFNLEKLKSYVDKKCQEDEKRIVKYYSEGDEERLKNSIFQYWKNKTMFTKIKQFCQRILTSDGFDNEVKILLGEKFKAIQENYLKFIPQNAQQKILELN
jgi:hypothetical protein